MAIWKDYLKTVGVIEEKKSSTDRARETLSAIMKATVKSDNKDAQEIWDMANDILQWYDENGSFTPGQAKWIYNTSQSFFNK